MGLQRGHKKNRNSLPEERGQVPREGMVSIEKSFHAITYSEPIFSYKNDWQWEMGCVVRSKMSFTFLLHWGISDCILPNPREVKWSERSEGMCSILNLLTDLSLGIRKLKVCEAESGETLQTQKRWGGGEDHPLCNSLTQSPDNTQQLHYAMQSLTL